MYGVAYYNQPNHLFVGGESPHTKNVKDIRQNKQHTPCQRDLQNIFYQIFSKDVLQSSIHLI